MTLRELISELQKLPTEALDKKVLTFADGNKPEYQYYDDVMFVDYNNLWDDENNEKIPVIHID